MSAGKSVHDGFVLQAGGQESALIYRLPYAASRAPCVACACGEHGTRTGEVAEELTLPTAVTKEEAGMREGKITTLMVKN